MSRSTTRGCVLECNRPPSDKISDVEKVVRIFQSFEKADEADLHERQSMTPEERVEVFLEIQQRSFHNAADERLARVYRVLTLEQS